MGDPHIFLRWHENIDSQVKRRAAGMLASGTSMPLLVNDNPTVGGFLDAGVSREDAWDYCIIGCNELGIPGRSAESATASGGLIQYLELLNQTLLSHPDVDTLTMEALLRALEDAMRTSALEMRKLGQERRHRTARMMPTPFTSALMHRGVGHGQDMLVGVKYHLPGIYDRGLANAVNAVAAIQQLVFEETSVSLSELVIAIRDNYAGHETLLSRIHNAPKWGNDNDDADRWAGVLIDMRERVLDAVDAECGTGPHMQCHVVRSLHYIDGYRIAASPDGRLAGQPVADSIGAEAGTAREGPMGVLHSVLKLDASKYYRGGTNLNLTLPLASKEKLKMTDTVRSLVEGFFGQGGQELQIACLDAEMLRDAVIHPERHGNLVVRIAGFNARFVDLAPIEQEELIQRAVVAAST